MTREFRFTVFVFMEHPLPDPLAAYARAFPSLEVEGVERVFLADLSRRGQDVPGMALAQREADVVLRLFAQMAEHPVGRNLGMTRCRAYARRGAAATAAEFDADADLCA